MKEKIKKLEQQSRLLEPGPRQRKKVREAVLNYTEKFLDQIEDLKAFNAVHNSGKGLLQQPIGEDPVAIKKLISLIRTEVDHPALNPASGGHLGYIPGGGIYYSALGDYLADVTNRYAGVFYAGPGAVRMENLLIRWIARQMHYPATTSGNLTSGGSIANLVAICTARDAKKIHSKNISRSVIYLSAQAHHSVDKAIRIAGLGECILRRVKLDDRYRIDAKELDKQVRADKAKKLNPFLIIAAAGTTDVGAVDPLHDIGIIAKKTGCWFHVDAAYGGFFMLTREGRQKLRGIELSDSLVVDPHKGLFLPYGLGVVLVKEQRFLAATHFYQANYMQDTAGANDEPSPADLSPELTKHFRGMRLWLPLQLHGVKPFRACLEEKLMLAKYFYKEVRKLGFETGPAPELSVVTYRYIPKKGDPNAFNKKLVEAVQEDGRVFISSTLLDGKFTLRMACLAFRTHLSTIDTLLKVLRQKLKQLESSS